MKLSREQRWMLANQYQILEKLYPEEAELHSKAREVLENGFELNYDWIAEHVYEDTMSEDACQEVIYILDMFSALERSYQELPEKPAGVTERHVMFFGFDGNHETEQFSYASFLIQKEGKFQELADHGDRLNSHAPFLDAYRRMLLVWQQLPIERKYDLSADDIQRIAAAGPHPGN
jgi:uncharacterized protein YfbU (UPF0304 family)